MKTYRHIKAKFGGHARDPRRVNGDSMDYRLNYNGMGLVSTGIKLTNQLE